MPPRSKAPTPLTGLPTTSASRRGKWLVLGLWIVLAMALGPLAGKVGEVEDTSANAFLPGGAESARVNTELERFRGGGDEIIPAVAVYTVAGEDGRIDAAAREKVEADRSALAGLATEGEAVSEPIPSEDGRALMLVIPTADSLDTLDEIREIVSANAPPGLDTAVGGPLGSLGDSVEVFDSLDSTLLIATALVVTVLLLITYRSPILWIFPLVAVGFAMVLTQVGTYLLAKYAGLPVDPQSAGILMVLVFGVGTDYALLLIARYREELRRISDRHEAMRIALRRCLPAILASAGTIAAGLSCLAFADINSSRSLGLVGAVGAVCAFLALVTVLPALLVIAGRWVFWPFVPRFDASADSADSAATDPAPGAPGASGRRTVWARIGAAISAHPRRSWVVSAVVTAALALGAVGIDMGLKQSEMYQSKPESVVAQDRISAHYPSGSSDPAVIVTASDAADEVTRVAERVSGVAAVNPADRTEDGALTTLDVVLRDTPDSDAAKDTVEALRTAVHQVQGADALVGGTTAETLDTQRAAAGDLRTVIPIVLLVVLLVLVCLLRSLVAPLVLLVAAVLSNLAALGAACLLFEHVLGYAGVDWSLPLMGFVFLTALGIDYTMFLMTRVREEVEGGGTAEGAHARGVVAGLTSTGGVITSAGVVLAATFAVFAVLPLVTMAQMGILVGLGVLLDTLLVRTILVPALVLDLGHRTWWPGRLYRRTRPPEPTYAPDGFPTRHPERV